VTGESCAPATGTPPSPTPPPSWTTAVLACAGDVDLAACGDPASLACVSPASPPPSYQRCVYQTGDQTCPSAYPQKQSLSTDADDTRGCTPCACDTPAGSYCTAELDVFKDGACTQPLLSDPVSSLSAPCFDITPPGPALGSMSVDKVTYTPGTCAPSGGQPTGTATATGLVTLCCAP
jgi:hypothetical protein